ncbi:MAG TPA: hypothetical protein VGJ18_09180 [Gemmatimonadaceae bacterium]|jgi:hypothetical protein
MLGRQDALSSALIRAQGFLDENAAQLTSVDFTTARKRLDEVAASFSSHAFDQDLGSRGAQGETAIQRELRLKLRKEQMEPVALIARRNLRTVPDFTALKLPKPKVLGQAFLASARGMAAAATIHKDTLIAHGLPATFLDDFTTAITNLEGSLTTREQKRSQHIHATKALSTEESNGRTVLSVLDALVKQAVGKDEALLAAWKSARRIRRRPGARAGATEPATTPATAPSAAATPAAVPVVAVAATPLSEGGGSPAAAAA